MRQRVAQTSRGLGAVWGVGAAVCSDHVRVTTVKDEIQEWTRVFHNHSAIFYKIQKCLYKEDIYTKYQKRLYKDDIYITKTTCTTLERLRRWSICFFPFGAIFMFQF
jgi:hypothetical protein